MVVALLSAGAVTSPVNAARFTSAWPAVAKSQVMLVVLVPTRSAVSVAPVAPTMYCGVVGAPPPLPGGTFQVPSARRKLAVPPPEAGTSPLADELNSGASSVPAVKVRPLPMLTADHVLAAER